MATSLSTAATVTTSAINLGGGLVGGDPIRIPKGDLYGGDLPEVTITDEQNSKFSDQTSDRYGFNGDWSEYQAAHGLEDWTYSNYTNYWNQVLADDWGQWVDYWDAQERARIALLKIKFFLMVYTAQSEVLAFGNGVKTFLPKGWRLKFFQYNAARSSSTVLKGAVKSNYGRFVKKIAANSKSSATFKQLKDGNYLFEATSKGKVPGSKAVYHKWVNPQGETFKMIKTTYAPDGSIIHVKSKF